MKTPLLILHGAIGASVQLKAIADSLAEYYDVHLFDLPGHGGKPMPVGPFSISLFADAVKEYIAPLPPVTILGYSMGGYIALYLAKHHPEKIERVITLGTKFHWDEATAAMGVKTLDPDVIMARVPAFGKSLEVLHAPNDWKEVLKRTADLMVSMGQYNPLHTEGITVKTLIMQGDRDEMVPLEETVKAYKSIPGAQMAVLPNTPHPIEKVHPEVVAAMVRLT